MPVVKWSEDFYVAAFEAAKDGLSTNAIARKLGVQWGTFSLWMKKRPALMKAVERGRVEAKPARKRMEQYRDLILGRMSEECRDIWEKLTGGDKDAKQEAIQAMEDGGQEIRRKMFIQAILATNFSYASAKAALKVKDEEFAAWLRYPGFAEMLQGLQNAKKDFFEGAMIDAVMRGETAAVIHANKTVNRDRGYGEKIVIEDNRPQEESAGRREQLSRLSVAEREQLLELLRKAKEPALIGSSPPQQTLDPIKEPVKTPAKAPRQRRKRPEGVE